ncbi:MAG: MATE family efflux transporter [Phaeodactylibacter sp.]|nr:MATE family efflux transporter [Phaeodactylibacter sp.]MCB9272845.1 MATE family efflux transporter [Lewinellaceae bacterium]
MWNEVRHTLRLGWPIILGNLTQMMLGVIDSAMVGAIHSSQLAAASFVNNIITVPFILGIGLTMAISPLVANAMGEGDSDKPMRILYNGLWVVGIATLLLAVAIHLGVGIVYHMGQDLIVAELSKKYLVWMAWGMVPMVLFIGMKQFADGLGKTKAPMYIALASLPLNVLLNYMFIFGKLGAPRLELEGAGIGTLISRIAILAAIALLIFRSKGFSPYRRHLHEQLRLKKGRLRDIVRIGIPSALQYGMEAGSFAVSGIMAGWLGYTQQAAHQIALGLASVTFMVSLGISVAGSIRVAYAHGKRDWAGARSIGKTTLVMAVAYGLFCALLFIVGRHHLPLLFNDEAEVLSFSAMLLLLAAVFQISDSVQAVGVGLLRGIQDVRIPTVFVGVAYWAIGIPTGYWLAFHAGMEISGIWTGFIAGLSASALLLTVRFLRLSKAAKNRMAPG